MIETALCLIHRKILYHLCCNEIGACVTNQSHIQTDVEHENILMGMAKRYRISSLTFDLKGSLHSGTSLYFCLHFNVIFSELEVQMYSLQYG